MIRLSLGKYETGKIEFVVDDVSGSRSPPATGTAYAFQMPDELDPTRIFCRSGENDAPAKLLFAKKSATEYCVGLKDLSVSPVADSAERVSPAQAARERARVTNDRVRRISSSETGNR